MIKFDPVEFRRLREEVLSYSQNTRNGGSKTVKPATPPPDTYAKSPAETDEFSGLNYLRALESPLALRQANISADSAVQTDSKTFAECEAQTDVKSYAHMPIQTDPVTRPFCWSSFAVGVLVTSAVAVGIAYLRGTNARLSDSPMREAVHHFADFVPRHK